MADNVSRIPYFAIPSLEVPSSNITQNNDVITKGYADTHYTNPTSVDASALPVATSSVRGAVKVGTTMTIANEVLDVNKVTAVSSSSTDVQIATAKAVYTFASNASNLASGTVAVARLPKANGTGSGNAGAVYVADANKGLTISSGAISVNFATYSSWDSSDAVSAVTPAYVKSAITGLGLNNSTVSGGATTAAGKFVKLDSNGLLDSSLIPSLAITDTFEASSQTAMLALSSAKKGDICIRSDVSKTFILTADGYSTLANWKELATPTDAVLSVNGKTGAVTQANLGLVTSISSSANNNDTTIPSSKAVMSYVGTYAATVTHNHNASEINAGTLSNDRLNKATNTTLGIASFSADSFSVSSGAVTLKPAGDKIGGVKVTAGNGLTYDSTTGALSMGLATASAAGAVIVTAGNGLAYSSNKISVSLANGSNAGTVKQGTGITIASGSVSVNFATSSNVASNLTSDVLALTPKGLSAAAIDTFSASATGRVIKTNSAGQIAADFIPCDNETIFSDGERLEVSTDAIAAALGTQNHLSKTEARDGYLSLAGAGINLYESKGYNVGDVVAFNGKLWRCTSAHTSAQIPEQSSGYWIQVSLATFNTFKATIGNNTASNPQTDFVVNHYLNDQDVDVTVLDDETNVEVFVGIEHTSANSVTIKFGTAPGTGKQYRVICRR